MYLKQLKINYSSRFDVTMSGCELVFSLMLAWHSGFKFNG